MHLDARPSRSSAGTLGVRSSMVPGPSCFPGTYPLVNIQEAIEHGH